MTTLQNGVKIKGNPNGGSVINPATAKQVSILMSLGVKEEYAASLTSGEAYRLIGKYKK